ncbi:DUF2510 domain-containing protein [Curtobacterium sp. MCLR17_007]|uniref:DUF2510 domain-containing protein n=1 Tax=unclassified Curtobacterium TaxID=257496 RepID=UPI0006FEFB94|nr:MULTISPECIES: DUF2510 domain-containing protein [unclassified Curtobacterium]KQS14840.1 hypothetical protein ASG04_03195 [Curtobacterium sp. Leaf183]WIB59687.1 DUF2510 domain-containing protein [Curtobacterium sp. MCLR17_007]
MTLPAAGWFPDPRDASRLRWWDGRAWGDGTRPLPARHPVAAPVVATPTGPSFSVMTPPTERHTWAYGAATSRRLCAFAVSAAVLAIASLVLNPWGAFSVLAVLAGAVGIVRPGATGRWRVLARSVAASAIVVALGTGLVALSAATALF